MYIYTYWEFIYIYIYIWGGRSMLWVFEAKSFARLRWWENSWLGVFVLAIGIIYTRQANTICKYRCYINRFVYGLPQGELDPHSEFSHPITSPNLIKRPSPYTQARTTTICKYRHYINRFLYGLSQDKLDPHSEFSHPITSPNMIKRPSPYTQARTIHNMQVSPAAV